MENQEKLIQQLCRGDESAMTFLNIIAHVSQVWDDLIDKDKPIHDAQINSMMWQALIDLNENQFFANHLAQLLPLMKKAIIDWQCANAFEREKDATMFKVSYIKRSCVTDIAIFVAYLCGGLEHSLQCAVLIERAVFQDDDFNEYVKEQTGG